MDMISRIGLVMSVMLCAGAGYLFFVPKNDAQLPVAAVSGSARVREIEVPVARDETLQGEIVEQADGSHAIAFNPGEKLYSERYGEQHIGEGAFQTFDGGATPHFLKPLGLSFEAGKEYLFLEGISENRVFEITLNTAEAIHLALPNGQTTVFLKTTE